MKRDEWNARYSASELVWGVEPNRFVAAEAGDLPAGRALDLACGEGRNAIWLAQRGWRVIAADFADAAIEKGRKLAAGVGVEVDWRVDDVVTWVPPDRSFDLVLCSYLQLPPDERAVVFTNAAAAVAPGGTFLVVAHDTRNLTDGYGGPQEAPVLYRAADVVQFLDGFTIVQAGEIVREVTRPDGTAAHAIDCLVRAQRSAASAAGA
jgi:2-polyprenyl-3-methyl-5-hydroxy-6-metoxy-1,4-benzoquinol methylase